MRIRGRLLFSRTAGQEAQRCQTCDSSRWSWVFGLPNFRQILGGSERSMMLLKAWTGARLKASNHLRLLIRERTTSIGQAMYHQVIDCYGYSYLRHSKTISSFYHDRHTLLSHLTCALNFSDTLDCWEDALACSAQTLPFRLLLHLRPLSPCTNRNQSLCAFSKFLQEWTLGWKALQILGYCFLLL